MVINDWVHLTAGSLVLTGLVLGTVVSPWGYLISAFVGANLLQFGLTKFCPLGSILRRLGVAE